MRPFGLIVLSQAGLFIFLLVAGIYLYFFHEKPPMAVNNQPVLVDRAVFNQDLNRYVCVRSDDDEVFQPGDRLCVHFDGCFFTTQPPKTTYSLVRGDHTIPAGEMRSRSGVAEGCYVFNVEVVTVPPLAGLSPGQYRLEATTHFNVNPFSEKPSINRTVMWETQEFEIVPTNNLRAIIPANGIPQ